MWLAAGSRRLASEWWWYGGGGGGGSSTDEGSISKVSSYGRGTSSVLLLRAAPEGDTRVMCTPELRDAALR